MNDLGMTLAWLAVQVAMVLVPSMILHTLASRRGPESGAWVATWSLGLVLTLSLVGFLPKGGASDERGVAEPAMAEASLSSTASPMDTQPTKTAGAPVVPASRELRAGRPFASLRMAWERFGHRAAEPASRVRRWGSGLAVVALVGSILGLIRLGIGLWAVGLCRRRGRRVDDPPMVALVDELRASMGVRSLVELREVPDLTTPATAGWRRPMLLLPDDWRTWDGSERRAVVAHELAHILRGDYAAGLLARVAVVLHWFHPLVRWQAARLQLQQELAADALGARFAGGRSTYLVALSSLALRQDGRSPSWPARAFLPARGTLIRRIKMLRNETESRISRRGWPRAGRPAMALSLLGLTIGVASLKGPARAADEKPQATPIVPDVRTAEAVAPFNVNYVPAKMRGVVAFRPAAMVRHKGMDTLMPLIQTMVIGEYVEYARQLKVDTNRPGFLTLRIDDIESVVSGFNIGVLDRKKIPNARPDADLHTLEFGGVTVRTVAPFDWRAFFRQWNVKLKEIKEARGVYYLPEDPAIAEALMGCAIYLPDDRTIVFESEKGIKDIIGCEGTLLPPAYLRGADWGRASRGLIAVSVNNENESFSKNYDLGINRPDDAVVLSLFKGVDRWVIGVPDSDDLGFRAEGIAVDAKAAEVMARSIEGMVKMGLATLAIAEPAENLPDPGIYAKALGMAQNFLTKLKSAREGQSVMIRAQDFGTMADLAAIMKADHDAEQARAKQVEADLKTRKK